MKLCDFGLAKEVLEPIYEVCGTPTYVAPEILSETGKLDFKIINLFSNFLQVFTNFYKF